MIPLSFLIPLDMIDGSDLALRFVDYFKIFLRGKSKTIERSELLSRYVSTEYRSSGNK